MAIRLNSAGPSEIIGLGEVLWDELPCGRQLGGAPFNFAFHCRQLGRNSAIVSRVGNDDAGKNLLRHVADKGLLVDFIQIDPTHPTGSVRVSVNADGQPEYDILTDVAYDHLEWNDSLETHLPAANVVCFGTLVQRHPASFRTVRRCLEAARDARIVFDINLRQNYFHCQMIEESLQLCDWVKLNEDELARLRDLLDVKDSQPCGILFELRERYDIQLAALTRGGRGCLVQSADEEIDLPGEQVAVVDTIGAGDAFTAGLVVKMLEGRSLRQAALFANRFAGRVAAAAGGTPTIARDEIDYLANE